MMRYTRRTVARPHVGDSRAVLSGRTIAAAGVVLLLAALLYALAAEARIGYDTAYQLVWGRELLDGALPGYDVRLAPTPHPLQVLVAIPLALLGQGADEAMRALSLVSFAALGVALYRAGTLLFSAPVGWLAAALVLTRPHLLELAYLADADIPAAALAAWAAVAALRGRAAVALGLLALAGLLRPEAWVLSLAYLAWLAWSARAVRPGLAALAVAAPLLWVLSDLAVTGDLLWSLHHTRTGTELLDRDTGVGSAVSQLPRHLNFLLGSQVLVVALLGLVAGLLAARERMWGLVAVLVLLGGSFGVLAVAGLSLQPRYLAEPGGGGRALRGDRRAGLDGGGERAVADRGDRRARAARGRPRPRRARLLGRPRPAGRRLPAARGARPRPGTGRAARLRAGRRADDPPDPLPGALDRHRPGGLRRGAGARADARHADGDVGVVGGRWRRGAAAAGGRRAAARARPGRAGRGLARRVGVLRDELRH